MRINIYAEEMTDEFELVEAHPEGRDLVGVRVFLKSPDALHSTDEDDDRNAVTFWTTGSDTDGMTTQQLDNLITAIRGELRELYTNG